MEEIRIAGGGGSRIVISVERWLDRDDYRGRIDVKVGGWLGTLHAPLPARQFADFREQLELLHRNLAGEADLWLDDTLRIKLVGDGLGHVAIE
jgi:hypothetical protein